MGNDDRYGDKIGPRYYVVDEYGTTHELDPKCLEKPPDARLAALELVLDLAPDEILGVVSRRLDDFGERLVSLEGNRRRIDEARDRRGAYLVNLRARVDELAKAHKDRSRQVAEHGAAITERLDALESNEVSRDYVDDAIQRYNDETQTRLLRLEEQVERLEAGGVFDRVMAFIRCDCCGALERAELVGCECASSFAKTPAGWCRVEDRHYCGDACRDIGERRACKDCDRWQPTFVTPDPSTTFGVCDLTGDETAPDFECGRKED